MRRNAWRAAFLNVLLTACGGGSSVQTPVIPPPIGPPNVRIQQVLPQISLSFPVGLSQAPNDNTRWFALERTGRVRVFDNNVNGMLLTFLDIRARVDASANEAGLLGIAFHPDFANNGEVFLSYTRTAAPFESVISRFRSLDNNQTLDPNSEEIIITVLQDFQNHNGGNIVFGPDGYLYAGFGDGGSGGDPLGRAQDTTNLLGSIIRIDVEGGTPYAIPADNPFAQNPACVQGFGGPCPEIFAWGLRNPWRFSFDRRAGTLWAGDVGQADWEEVDVIEVGNNYGWNSREGAHCYPPSSSNCPMSFVDPITEYDHSVGISITGGFVYRGSAIPPLQGFYVFGDFGSGRIWAVAADSPIGTAAVEIGDTNLAISSFGEGSDGELYVLDFSSGAIYQITAQ